MATEKMYVVECRFVSRPSVTYRKYVTAASPDEAMKRAQEPGSVPLRALEANDPSLAAEDIRAQLARLEQQVSVLREDVAFLSRSDIIAKPYSTIIWGVMGAMIVSVLLGLAIGSFHR